MSSMTPRSTAEAVEFTGAACGSDPDLMFPVRDSQVAGQPTEQEQRALAVCAGCSHLSSCRQEALSTALPDGVAGGMTAADRRAVRRVALGTPRVRGPEQNRSPATAPPVAATTRGPLDGRSATLEPRVAALVAAHAPGADPTRVRALALGQDPSPRSASRDEVALAALARLGEGDSQSSTARVLEVDGNQVRRWRDRQLAGEALVQGEGPGRNAFEKDPTSGRFVSIPAPRSAPEPVTELEDDEIGDEDDEPEPGTTSPAPPTSGATPLAGTSSGTVAARPASLRTARRTPADGLIAAEPRPSTAPPSLRGGPARTSSSVPSPRPAPAAQVAVPSTSPAVSAAWADENPVGGGLDGRIAAALAAHLEQTARAAVDPAVVRELVEATGPAAASRWETAVAAVLLFEQGERLAGVARRLGEPLSEVRAWRRRYDHDEPLITGGPGVGLQQVPRPAHLVAAPVPAQAAA